MGGRSFKFWGFCFSLSYSDLIGNELISPGWVCFAHDSSWWLFSPCPYLNPPAFHYVFSLLSWWGGGVIEWLGGQSIQARSTHHNTQKCSKPRKQTGESRMLHVVTRMQHCWNNWDGIACMTQVLWQKDPGISWKLAGKTRRRLISLRRSSSGLGKSPVGCWLACWEPVGQCQRKSSVNDAGVGVCSRPLNQGEEVEKLFLNISRKSLYQRPGILWVTLNSLPTAERREWQDGSCWGFWRVRIIFSFRHQMEQLRGCTAGSAVY